MPFKKGQSGNPNGRPRKPAVSELEQALKKAGKKAGKTFMQHCADEAFTNPQMTIAILKKIIPDLKQTEVQTLLAGQLHHTIGSKTPDAITELIERVIERRDK